MAGAEGLRLYSRTYCHLCSEMAEALAPIAREYGASVQVIDVDSFPDIEAALGERVPVLMAGDRELCHYFLDEGVVREYLNRSV